MRSICLSLASIVAMAGGAGLLVEAQAQNRPKVQSLQPVLEGRLLADLIVRIPLRDESGATRATLSYIPGAGGKGAVTITDRDGSSIALLAASDLPDLGRLDAGRIRLSGADGKSDGGSNDRYLQEELRKLDARIKQLEARLRK